MTGDPAHEQQAPGQMTREALMDLLVQAAIKQPRRPHVPLRVWQERPREITWLCSCGCVNKHVPLPADLRCVDDEEKR